MFDQVFQLLYTNVYCCTYVCLIKKKWAHSVKHDTVSKETTGDLHYSRSGRHTFEEKKKKQNTVMVFCSLLGPPHLNRNTSPTKKDVTSSNKLLGIENVNLCVLIVF